MSEKIPPTPAQEALNIKKSSLREAYEILNANSPLELLNLYSENDQELMRSHSWDYKNPDLIVNRVKAILEQADENNLTLVEREWRKEILWFWYHHAISCAIWKYKDKQSAQKYAATALEFQSEDHPNKITKLLSLLVHDRVEEAEEWAKNIGEEPEKRTASDLINEYKGDGFF